LAFFFKHVCEVEDPVFNVKLRKTGTRVPVVLAKGETQRIFEKLEEPGPSGGRYALPARLQYGAGLRRSELVRLRIKDVDLERGTLTIHQGKGDKDDPLLRRRSAVRRNAPPHSLNGRRDRARAVDDDASQEPAWGNQGSGGGGAEGMGERSGGGAGRGAHPGGAGENHATRGGKTYMWRWESVVWGW